MLKQCEVKYSNAEKVLKIEVRRIGTVVATLQVGPVAVQGLYGSWKGLKLSPFAHADTEKISGNVAF